MLWGPCTRTCGGVVVGSVAVRNKYRRSLARSRVGSFLAPRYDRRPAKPDPHRKPHTAIRVVPLSLPGSPGAEQGNYLSLAPHSSRMEVEDHRIDACDYRPPVPPTVPTLIRTLGPSRVKAPHPRVTARCTGMSLALLGLCAPPLHPTCADSAPRRASPTVSARVGRVRFSAQAGALRHACTASPSPFYEEDEDADEAPWLRELTEQAVVENEQERAAEEKALRSRRSLSRQLTALVACAYLAAVSALLHFTPALRHVLRATPQQAALGLLALYTAELGWRCHCGVRSSLKVRRPCCASHNTRFTLWRAQALRRCELEVKLRRELGGVASVKSQDDPVLNAAYTSQRRAKDFLTALALAAPAELCGAALAAMAPHPAPGIALMCAAQVSPLADGPPPGGPHAALTRPVAAAAAKVLLDARRGRRSLPCARATAEQAAAG